VSASVKWKTVTLLNAAPSVAEGGVSGPAARAASATEKVFVLAEVPPPALLETVTAKDRFVSSSA
jgi:hypothetical protein